METLLAGKSPKTIQLREDLKRVAMSGPRLNVVLIGATGTGKELCAQAIRQYGPWRDKNFQALNCSGLNEHLIESQLFGHIKGAFTGAVNPSNGLLGTIDKDFTTKADKKDFAGFLFLDELHDMPATTQGLLLRLLESGEYRRLGDSQVRYANIRIITALQPGAEMRSRLRDDLYNRLAEVEIHLPTLNERRKDIPELAKHLLEKIALENNLKGYWGGISRAIDQERVQKLLASKEFFAQLQQHDWSLGNVRELRSVLKKALLLNQLELPKVDSATLSEAQHRAATQDRVQILLPDDPAELITADALKADYVQRAHAWLKELGESETAIRRQLDVKDPRTMKKLLESAPRTVKPTMRSR